MKAHRAYAVRWKDSPSWDTKSARATLFRLANLSFRPLSQFAEEATELVHPAKQPDYEWPVYGVSNTKGIFFSHYQLGRTFNTAYKRIRPDWFFHNPTRANVGSLGRVPDVPDDAITSPEYQVWRLRKGLIPDYVAILIRTRFFLGLIDFHRVGAVKQRLFVANLLEISIPVLTKDEQRSIVAVCNDAESEVGDTLAKIEIIQDKLEATFLRDLGLTKPAPAELPKNFAARWSDFRRWSVSYNQRAQTAADLTQGTYPVVALGSCLDSVQYGTSEKANSGGCGTPILRIKNVKGGEIDAQDLKRIELPESARAALLLSDGDILFIRTSGSRHLVGTCAVFHETSEFVFASYLIRLQPNAETALSDYLAYFINCLLGQAQIDAVSRQIMQNNINAEEIRALAIPLPPLPVQEQLVERIGTVQKQIAALRAEASQRDVQARAEVETMILGRRPGAAGQVINR